MFLRSDHSLPAHQHRVWWGSASDVFRLVANDCRNPRFEIFGRFDWPLHLPPFISSCHCRVEHKRGYCLRLYYCAPESACRMMPETMKSIAIIAAVMLACAFGSVSQAATTKGTRHSTKIHTCATCTGSDPCYACKNCHYCKHCAQE